MRALEITQDLVRIPSLTPDHGPGIAYVESFVRQLGFTCQRLDRNGTANLYAFLNRGEGPHLAYAGHTDVVCAGDPSLWSSPPFEASLHGNKLIGRGVADMKGSIGAFLAALEGFVQTPFQGTLSLFITGDEEGSGVDGTPYILSQLTLFPDLCLVGEPASDTHTCDQIKIGRRGSVTGKITVHGTQGHVAYPHLAQNPIPALMHVLQDLMATHLDAGSAHFDPSHFEITSIDVGNKTANIIPQKASASFSIRFNDNHTHESLKLWLEKAFQNCPLQVAYDTRCSGNPFYTHHEYYIACVSRAIEEVTGHVPRLSTSGGTSDGRFIAQYCPVIECGLSHKTIHGIDECIFVEDLDLLTQCYAKLLHHFLIEKHEMNP